MFFLEVCIYTSDQFFLTFFRWFPSTEVLLWREMFSFEFRTTFLPVRGLLIHAYNVYYRVVHPFRFSNFPTLVLTGKAIC